MGSEAGTSTWSADRIRSHIQEIDDYQFEHFIAELWEHQGWDTTVEQQASDAGVDIRATKSTPYPKKALIQAKRYSDSNRIGGPAIQQYSALKQQEPDTDESIIVTTGYFTGAAEERGRELNVKLIDGDDLVALIDGLDAYDILEEYIDTGVDERTGESAGAAGMAPTGRPEDRVLEQLSAEQRTELETLVDQDLEDYLTDERYRAQRGVERAQDTVHLNPHDAAELDIFPDTSQDYERVFEQRKAELVVRKDDLHFLGNGNLYVEDITEYVPTAALDEVHSGRVIGVIQHGVSDKAWMADGGEAVILAQSAVEWGKQTVQEAWEANVSDSETTGATSVDDGGFQRTPWFYLTAGSILGWVFVLCLVSIAPNSAEVFGGLVILLSWAGLPIGILFDAKRTGLYDDARKTSVGCAVAAVFPVFAIVPGLVYLLKRRWTDWPDLGSSKM